MQKYYSKDLEHLFWLAARDYIFFSEYDDLGKWSNGWCASILCNDTFGYACADCEELEPGNAEEVRKIADKYGWDGVTAWAAFRRGCEPIKPLLTEKYYKAREEIKKLVREKILEE